MDLSKSGHRFAETQFVAGSRLSSANYARALGVSVSGSLEPPDRVIVPAMLGFHLALPGEAMVEELGFTWGRTLNLGIDIDWMGLRVTEDDIVRACATVESTWERAKKEGSCRQFMRVSTEFFVGPRLVGRWRVLFTEMQDQLTRSGIPDEDPEAGTAPSFDPAKGGQASEFEGDVLPDHTIPAIDRLSLARMSVALDNPDPLHVDDAVAKAAGFDQVIGHGGTVVGLLHEPVRRAFGIGAPVRMATRQLSSFTLGDVLSATGQVSERETGLARCATQVAIGSRVVGTAEIEVHNC